MLEQNAGQHLFKYHRVNNIPSLTNKFALIIFMCQALDQVYWNMHFIDNTVH